MGKYNKEEKETLSLLNNQDIADIKLVGNAIQPTVFKAGEAALLVDCANHKAMLFFPVQKPYKHEDRKTFAKLVSLLTFVETLEKKGLIYLQPSNAGCELFFYENFKFSFLHGIQKNGIIKDAISQREHIEYDVDENITINIQGIQVPKTKSDILYITKDGSRIMQSTDVSILYDRINKFLCSRAFPTSDLSRFIDNGYYLDEEKRSVKSLRYAIASFIVAMSALIVSMPCVSIWYSNRYSYSTMDTIQYNNIVKKLNALERNNKGMYYKPDVQMTDDNKKTNTR